MPATKPRTRRPEDRRDELLDAAEQIFLDKGVASTTVSDVTDAAGVAKGTFYLYFDSKDHLVARLHERLTLGMEELVGVALADLEGANLIELAEQVVAAIIDYWIDHRDLYVEIWQAGDSRETARIVAECDERVIEMMEAGIWAGVTDGQFEVDSPGYAARFLFWGCHGTSHTALVAEGPVDRDELVRGSQQIVRKLLTPSS